jgi:hypothetical protein
MKFSWLSSAHSEASDTVAQAVTISSSTPTIHHNNHHSTVIPSKVRIKHHGAAV